MPYQLLDTWNMEVLSAFFTQDRAMQELYNQIRVRGAKGAKTLNLIYVDADEAEHLLCYASELRILDWFADLEQLTLRLRIEGGTDILGIGEFIQSVGYNPTWYETDTPLTELDMKRYSAHIGAWEIAYRGGATKLEALARCYLGYKEMERTYGRSTTA